MADEMGHNGWVWSWGTVCNGVRAPLMSLLKIVLCMIWDIKSWARILMRNL